MAPSSSGGPEGGTAMVIEVGDELTGVAAVCPNCGHDVATVESVEPAGSSDYNLFKLKCASCFECYPLLDILDHPEEIDYGEGIGDIPPGYYDDWGFGRVS